MSLFEDLATTRRRVLQLLGGAALLPLVGCGDDAGGGSCVGIPEETAGPFPGDGSIGPNALATPGVVRSDLRTSFGGLVGTAGGVPLTLRFTLVDRDCAPLAERAVYVWQCDREARYSLYTAGATDQNYLRGVLATDSAGVVTFTSIFPACYTGRWPHVHFEVYADLEAATTGGTKLVTSQLALPEATCDEVYATAGYESSVAALAQVSLASDSVFRDGFEAQLATVTGDMATSGLVASLTIAV